MPKYSIISAAQRRNWLEEHEKGRPLEVIAKEAKRDQRTVKTNVERARLERDFEGAQQEQLREALRSHQEDMLGLLGRLMQAVHVPKLGFDPVVAPDFGLESLLSSEDLRRNFDVAFGPALSAPEGTPGIPFLDPASLEEMFSVGTVVRNVKGPTQVLLVEEQSTLWRGVKEHIGARDPLWRNLSHWKQALLEECQARASLNLAIRIKVEEAFELPVLWGTGHHKPHLAAPMVGWVRTAASRVSGGEQASEVIKEVKGVKGVKGVEGDRMETVYGLRLAIGVQEPGKWGERLEKTIKALAGLPEAKVPALTFRNLHNKSANVQRALEEHLLIHHLPGRCNLCRKLGG